MGRRGKEGEGRRRVRRRWRSIVRGATGPTMEKHRHRWFSRSLRGGGATESEEERETDVITLLPRQRGKRGIWKTEEEKEPTSRGDGLAASCVGSREKRVRIQRGDASERKHYVFEGRNAGEPIEIVCSAQSCWIRAEPCRHENSLTIVLPS